MDDLTIRPDLVAGADVANLVTRAAVLDDAAALANLANIIETSAGGVAYSTEAEYRALLSGWLVDIEVNSRVLTTPGGEIVAVGLVAVPPPGGPRVDLSGGVHPKWTGLGIGRDLLGWQIKRAGELYKELAPEVEWILEDGALVGHEAAERLLTRYGFEVARYFMDMHADLAAIESRPSEAPDGLRVTTYTPELKERLYEAHMEAFSDHWGFQRRLPEKWEQLTVLNEAFRPELSRVVFDGDELAAYVLGYDGQPGELYIGQVGTRRSWRRRGLASLMLADVMVAAREAGLTDARLGVDSDSPTGAVGVYERVGFATGTRFAAYRRGLDL